MCRVLDFRVDFGRNVGKEQVGNNVGEVAVETWGPEFGSPKTI